MENRTVIVYRANDVIEREKLIYELNTAGVKTFGQNSSLNIVYPNTPNLYLGGISAVMDNYPIFVFESDLNRAKEIIDRVLKEAQIGSKEPSDSKKGSSPISSVSHLDRFYSLCFYSFLLPIVPLILAPYHLIWGIQNREKVEKSKMYPALFFLAFNLTLSMTLVIRFFNKK